MNNGVMFQYFEWYLPADGTLWKQVGKLAEKLSFDGVTSVWLPPAYKGSAGKNDVGYGVYDLYDLGEFKQKGTIATKYGTRMQYLDAIKRLQHAGINVYGDIVFNQMMGADKPELVEAVENAKDNREEVISKPEDIEAWTRFNFPGRKGVYSDFTWDHTCFSGVDWDQRKGKSSIYNFQGHPWNQGVDNENNNYDYLMGADVDFRVEKVRNHLLDWGKWYLENTGIDGFRLDALKHIDDTFFPWWLQQLRQFSKKELFAVGEYWSSDLGTLQNYIQESQRSLSLFDVPLHFNFFCASHSNGDYDMSHIFDNTLVAADNEKAVTFVDNHDTQAGQALQSAVMEWFVPLAYSLILLRPQGYPCVFYGDYYGVPSHNGKSFKKELDIMMKLRRNCVYGTQHDYFDDCNIIGWTLEGDQEHQNNGVAVILTDKDGGSKTMYVGKQHAGEVWIDELANVQEEITIDQDGNGLFPVNGGSVSCYRDKKDSFAEFVPTEILE